MGLKHIILLGVSLVWIVAVLLYTKGCVVDALIFTVFWGGAGILAGWGISKFLYA